MKRSTFFSLFVLALCWAQAEGQSTAGKGRPTATNAPPPNAIPGYTIKQIEGFNVILSDDTMKHNESNEFERKPVEVIEQELKTVVEYMKPEQVAILRKLLIWVEWDEETALSSGRQGGAVAVYYGGHQEHMLARGMHPLKAKNITVVSMKMLAAEHQPQRDSGRCVLLHEMTHAVHDRFLGFDNTMVQAAFKQAMERKLYDTGSYASTNEKEFFAELTCAYFDQLAYLPRNRSELEKHDPITYQMMTSIWGARKPVATSANAKAEMSEKLKIRLDEIDLGTPVLGATISPTDLKDRVALIVLWNAGDENGTSATFRKLNQWCMELTDFGLGAVAVHLTGSRAVDVKIAAEQLGVSFPVTEGRWTSGGLIENFRDFPLCLVFDPTGQCVFRGSTLDAEEAVRSALGAALVERAGLTTVPKPMAAQVDSLRKGKSPSLVLTQLVAHTRSSNAETAEAAKKLVAEMTSGGERLMTEAEPLMTEDPVAAYLKLERLPLVYKGSTLAAQANTLLGKLKLNKDVQLELKARPGLMMVRRLDTELGSRPGSFDPTLPDYRRDNAPLLGQLQQAVAQMRSTFPNTRAAAEAVQIGQRYSVAGP